MTKNDLYKKLHAALEEVFVAIKDIPIASIRSDANCAIEIINKCSYDIYIGNYDTTEEDFQNEIWLQRRYELVKFLLENDLPDVGDVVRVADGIIDKLQNKSSADK